MKTGKSLTVHRFTVEEGEEITVCAGGENGPENIISIDEYGIVTIECEYRKLMICSIDPGPGGIEFYVEGKHEDGTP